MTSSSPKKKAKPILLKNSFGSKGSQTPSYNVAVYDFLKGLYGELDKATEARQQNKILTALLEQIQSLLPQVEDQGKRTTFETGLAQLGKESDQTRLLQVGKHFYAKSVIPLKSKTKQTEEPQIGDVALYQQLYNQLMALHQQLQDKGASDAVFDRLEALFDQLANPKE